MRLTRPMCLSAARAGGRPGLGGVVGAGVGGRCTGRKKPFFTLVERGSRKALFLAEGDASGRTVATVLLRHVKRGSTVYTDEFRGYRRVSGLGYEHLSVRHSGGVYATGPVHVNGAESRNWLLRAFLFFRRGISLFHASFYAFAASAFVRLYAERPFSAFHWLIEVIAHAY